MHLSMVESVNILAPTDAMSAGIETHGKPIATYVDKLCVFRNNVALAKGDGLTHVAWVLKTVNIASISDNSRQAMGRVERANITLQDHLVTAMRVEGISNVVEAKAFVPGDMKRHNQTFTKPKQQRRMITC